MTPRLLWIGLYAGTLVAAVAIVGALLLVTRPSRIGITKGSVHLAKVRWNGGAAVVVISNYPNFLWQIEGIGVRREGNRFYLDQYGILWHPLCRFVTHRDWPVVIELDELPAGDYEVLYWTRDEGYVRAGRFNVPSPAPRPAPRSLRR